MPTVCPPHFLVCAACQHEALLIDQESMTCPACRVCYPLLAGVPWLFPAPAAALAEWRARFGRAQRELEDEHLATQRALASRSLAPLTRSRLGHLAQAQSRQTLQLRELLAPMLTGPDAGVLDAYVALRTRLPVEQGLTTYAANLHRDWCWGDVENTASLALVLSSLGVGAPGGSVLVLGAGGGRLAYDLHRASGAQHTVALDINPLLMLAAARIVDGAAVNLHEFPLAPRKPTDCAVLRELRAPQPVDPGFHLLLGDALCPPLRAGTFDAVITPWFLDIVQAEPADLARKVNHLLKPGGTWVNFGSLTFVRPEPDQRLGLDELLGVVEANGFSKPRWSESEIPYLCSPASRHARREIVVTFGAEKVKHLAPPPPHEALPAWIVAGTSPVPLLPSFQHQIAATRIHAFIMSLIDGKRSLEDIAVVLEQQRLMPRDEASAALRSFLTTMFDESRRSKPL